MILRYFFFFFFKLNNFYRPPFNLEDVDFSDNEIKEIPDLSKFRFLRKINLSQNNILKIEGISKNYYLQVKLFMI